MIKQRIESGLAWAEVTASGARTSCVYGFCDGTNNHGHTVLSGSEIIYQRDISGATLLLSRASLLVSGANLMLNCDSMHIWANTNIFLPLIDGKSIIF